MVVLWYFADSLSVTIQNLQLNNLSFYDKESGIPVLLILIFWANKVKTDELLVFGNRSLIRNIIQTAVMSILKTCILYVC